MDQAARRRDYSIDALRGVAIAAMVAAHLARDVLAEPHPLLLRVYGSLAAPLFVTLAGMLAAQTAASKNYPLGYYVQRGGAVLLLAALIDVGLWGLYPFVGMDVLYLIGVALPVAVVFSRLTAVRQLLAVALLLAVWTALYQGLGYREAVFAVALTEPPGELLTGLPLIVEQWLISGWFPLFPWLFFALAGAWLFQWRRWAGERFARQALTVGALLMLSGLLVSPLGQMPLESRAGYSELFYPPTPAFLLIALGSVLLMFFIGQIPWLGTNQGLIRLGQCSLLMYLVHLLVIHWVLMPLFEEAILAVFLLLYAALVLILIGLAGGVQLIKQRLERPLPFMLRFLLGG